MRLVAWNCRSGPFHAKIGRLLRLRPTLAVVSECPRPPADFEREHLWFGTNEAKGLALIASQGLQLKLACRSSRISRHAVPVLVSGLGAPFLLLGVWALGKGSDRYVRGVVDALHAYRSLVRSYPTVAMGDFNSNTIWDGDNPGSRNHTALVKRLAKRRMVSVYHEVNAERQGEESQPTFYLYNHEERPYHLDYCFIPQQWLSSVISMKVGTYRQWKRWSDHRPIVIDLDLVSC